MISGKFAEVADRDEDGFWHLHITTGATVAIAPSDDVPAGAIGLIDQGRISIAPLRGAFARNGHSAFWMNTEDFQRLMAGFDQGSIKPIRLR